MTWPAPLQNLARALFPLDGPLTSGERTHFTVLQVGVAALVLKETWPWPESIARLQSLVAPLGIGSHLDLSFLLGATSPYVLYGALAGALLLGTVRRSAWAYWAALLCFHLLYVTRYSLGKASHGTSFLGLAVLALALGTSLYKRDDPAAQQRFSFGFLFFFYGFGYVMAAICKMVATGPSWPAGAHLLLWMGEKSVDVTSSTGHFEPNAMQSLILQTPELGTAALTFGLVAEALGFLMWFSRYRPWIVTALIAMHIGIDFTMNIFFFNNICMLLLVGYPWGRWLQRFRSPESTLGDQRREVRAGSPEA